MRERPSTAGVIYISLQDPLIHKMSRQKQNNRFNNWRTDVFFPGGGGLQLIFEMRWVTCQLKIESACPLSLVPVLSFIYSSNVAERTFAGGIFSAQIWTDDVHREDTLSMLKEFKLRYQTDSLYIQFRDQPRRPQHSNFIISTPPCHYSISLNS